MPDILNEFSILAPAKVNLHLKVLDRREDGFHNIESLFLRVDFGDFLYFKLNENDNITEIVNINEIGNTSRGAAEEKSWVELLSDPERNIIYKAIKIFRNLTDFNKGIKIEVDKKIPIGGGLGGGSSNAASTLLALNKIAGFPLNRGSLFEAAASLGSDVPFFLHETTAAWVTGRGEIIEPVDVPKMFPVLVNPGFSSDTASAFSLLDEYRNSEFFTTNHHEPSRIEERFRSSSSCGLWLNNLNYFMNDFLEVFPEKEKLVYKDIISDLCEQGASYANLSGSGATCFGVFNNEKQARIAEETLKKKWEFVRQCCSI